LSNLEKDRIALFGTSADPPTIGHKKILEELSKIYPFIITYVSNNPKKRHQENMSNRSLLLRTLIEDLKNPKIIFNQKISSQWAIDSIKKTKEIYGCNSLDFVIGSDLIADIFYWKTFNEIVKEAGFLIIKREGYPIKSKDIQTLNKNNVNFKISTLNIPKISSSMVRVNTCSSNLPISLIDIVKKNNLYISSKLVE